MQGSKITANPRKYIDTSGTIFAAGCLSMSIRVVGAGTTFLLWGIWPLTELDAPLNLPFYDYRNSRRMDEITFLRTAGAGSLLVVTDQDITCQ